MNYLKEIIALQKNEGYTNLEMSTMLSIPENTWEQWRSGRRSPRGPAITIIKWAISILNDKPLTKKELLAKTGRTGKLTDETRKELNKED